MRLREHLYVRGRYTRFDPAAGYPAPTSSVAKSRACHGVDVFQQYLSSKLIVGYTLLYGYAVQCLFIGGSELGTGGAVCADCPGAAISCDVRGHHLPDVV